MLNIYDTLLSIIEISERISNSNQKHDVVGRTAIQKISYFTKQTCDDLELFEFKPYFYGPYNPEVSMALEDLISYSFVDEKKIHGKRYDAYVYRLTDDGKFILNKNKSESIYNNIKALIEKCYEACGLKATPLSYAAKMHYIFNESKEKDVSVEQLKERGEKLGWDLNSKDIEQGIDLLKKLEIIK